MERTRQPQNAAADRPLRVLLITQVAGGGVGRHFVDLAQGFAARNLDVVGIHPTGKLDAHFADHLYREGLPPMHALHMGRNLHPRDAVDLWQLVRKIKSLGRFDIIHGHSSKAGALARLAARYLGIPSVYTPNALVTLDPTLSARKRDFYKRVELWLSHSTAALIAVSHDEADHMRDLGMAPQKVHVVANGIERPKFPGRELVRARLGLQSDEIAVGFVGRLASQKAPNLMVDAFGQALRRQPKLRLLMVGSGPLEAETRQQIASLGLESHVRLLGDVVATDIMPAMDMFCLSSRYEGMPYVLLEALAAGLPIVSTRVSGATMCVEPDVNGLIVPAEASDELAAALATVAANGDLQRRFAAASQAMSERFSADRMVSETLAVYRHVLGRAELTREGTAAEGGSESETNLASCHR